VNNREYHPYIDPTVDLVTSDYKFFGHDDWVVQSTPYDIRRMEDVISDLEENGPYQFPHLDELLLKAGLPAVTGCVMDTEDEAFVCSFAPESS